MTESRDRDAHGSDVDTLTAVYQRTRNESPPPQVDAAVLARARQAVNPPGRGRRWWIPVSVAASALVAVSLVLRIEREAAVAPTAVESPGPAATSAAPFPAEPAARPAQEIAERLPPEAEPATPARVPAPAAPAAGEPAAAPRVSADADRALSAPDETFSAPVTSVAAPESVGTARSRLDESTTETDSAAAMRSAKQLPAPEAWLERIEQLEAEGRLEEAAAERAALEAAYPGWLAERRSKTQ